MIPITKSISFFIREAVRKEIGIDNFESFELWAFKKSPSIYDQEIIHEWNWSHNYSYFDPDDISGGLAKIVRLWNETF